VKMFTAPPPQSKAESGEHSSITAKLLSGEFIRK